MTSKQFFSQLEVLIRNEEDASMALHVSNNLTKALLHFRMHTTPHVSCDREGGGLLYPLSKLL